MKKQIQAFAVSLLAASAASAQQAVQWRVEDGGNGHWYAYYSDARSWHEARRFAESVGGHLATISSDEEASKIRTLGDDTCWIGLFQNLSSDSYAEPNGGWEWVTGEPLQFTHWRTNVGQPNEPNDWGGGENWAHLDAFSVTWNDLPDGAYPFAVEWSSDCNGDGVTDIGQVFSGALQDADQSWVPDCCELPADCTADTIGLGIKLLCSFDGIAADTSGSGRRVQVQGATYAADRFGTPAAALEFNGQSSWARIDGVPVPADNEFSWSLWIRPFSVNQSGRTPVIEWVGDVGSPQISPCLYVLPSGSLQFYSWHSGAWTLETPTGAALLNQWTHVVVTSSSTRRRRIFVNGMLAAESLAGPEYGLALGVMLLGRDSGDWIPRFAGQLDDVRVYSKELTPAEVATLRWIGDPAPCRPDLVPNGAVDGADLGVLLFEWGQSGTGASQADLNRDGAIDGSDLGALLNAWGPCPS